MPRMTRGRRRYHCQLFEETTAAVVATRGGDSKEASRSEHVNSSANRKKNRPDISKISKRDVCKLFCFVRFFAPDKSRNTLTSS